MSRLLPFACFDLILHWMKIVTKPEINSLMILRDRLEKFIPSEDVTKRCAPNL
jgi:hypothetical protein